MDLRGDVTATKFPIICWEVRLYRSANRNSQQACGGSSELNTTWCNAECLKIFVFDNGHAWSYRPDFFYFGSTYNFKKALKAKYVSRVPNAL